MTVFHQAYRSTCDLNYVCIFMLVLTQLYWTTTLQGEGYCHLFAIISCMHILLSFEVISNTNIRFYEPNYSQLIHFLLILQVSPNYDMIMQFGKSTYCNHYNFKLLIAPCNITHGQPQARNIFLETVCQPCSLLQQ